MAAVRRKYRKPTRDDATAKEMYRQARIAVAGLSPEKRNELANMFASAYDWNKAKREWEK